ncbi:PIN domain-containing protein [Asticcacaulis sp. EMRT-3]|uniref:PIN domain-containing protein n=1 Tax=Asticcacaulis sp. EMRT-3 TaxID=3040349 RepID=UPI0024AEFC51|nr:PIN domain-containing protein [Asticcacaulis sp. EMRT-3]MDI7774704.1 PIN domain-containing protein [Asticcacaulis sp. EMRT-3]
MIILDTNVVSELMKPQPDFHVHDWLMQLGEIPLTTTTITVAEIEYGLQRLPNGRRKTELQASFAAYIQALAVLPFDEVAAYKAGQFRAIREASGQAAHPSDMMIAGIAAAAGAALATRNIKDFDGLQIPLSDPWRAH